MGGVKMNIKEKQWRDYNIKFNNFTNLVEDK